MIKASKITATPLTARKILALKVGEALGGSLSAYAVNGFEPGLVIDPSNDYYLSDAGLETLASLLTFSRASTATYVDSSGAIQTATTNTPRINHVRSGGAWVPGLMIETEARTNLLLNSATLSTQTVTVTNVAHTLHFTGTGTVTLSGTSTAGPLVGTGTGEENRVSLTFTPTAGSLTLTVSGTVSNAQLEAAETPSSYIPTSGSTATRAAETVTIPSAKLPWPEPNVIGSELVTNGTFDTDASGWTLGGASTWNSGAVDIDVPGVTNALIQDTGSNPVGKKFLISFEISNHVIGSVRPQFGSTNGTFVSGNGVYEQEIAAVSTSGLLTFTNGGNPLQCTMDNISIRELGPISVSIAMDGFVTYADTNQVIEVHFAQWGSSDYIWQFLRTDGAGGTGGFYFWQRDSGALSATSTSANAISPGANLPFSIASRHGITFINGAVDGTALTANTTPTALPDLSAANLILTPKFMGTITSFRIWDEDIGDAGIEEASA